MLSTGVIGARLPLHKLLPGLEPAVAALSRGRRRRRGRGDHDHRHAPKEAAVARDGFTVGGMAKGSGMIHPDLATMLAVVTTDYPLEPGEAIEFLRPAVETSFNAISVDGEPLDERLRDPARERRERIARRRRPTRRSPPRSREVCADLARQVVADGEGITVLARDQRHRRRRRRPGEGDRPPHRDLAARQDRALRPRRQLGPRADGRRVSAPWNGGYAAIDAGSGSRSATTARSSSTAARRPTSSRTSRARAARSTSTSASATGSAGYLTSDLSYDYVRINADYRT